MARRVSAAPTFATRPTIAPEYGERTSTQSPLVTCSAPIGSGRSSGVGEMVGLAISANARLPVPGRAGFDRSLDLVRTVGEVEAVPVAGARDEELLRREAGQEAHTVRRDVNLLLDACGGVLVVGGPVRLDREDHPFLDLGRMLERVVPAHQRLLPHRETHAVAVLEAERRLLAREAEVLGGREVLDDVRRAGAGTDLRYRSVHVVAGALVRVPLLGV